MYNFSYKEFLRIKETLNQDAYYKALRVLCNYFEEIYLDNDNIVTEINKIRRIAKKPACNADIYTPTDQELLDNLNKLKALHDGYFKFYLALVFSGVRVREMETLSNNPDHFRVVAYDLFKKVVVNTNRTTKKCYYIYLPQWFDVPSGIDIDKLSRFLAKHKDILRPKYIRNWFYSKCLDLGVHSGIIDFYQGRASVTVGDKHYLDKERMADRLYKEKLVNYFSEMLKNNENKHIYSQLTNIS